MTTITPIVAIASAVERKIEFGWDAVEEANGYDLSFEDMQKGKKLLKNKRNVGSQKNSSS